MDDKISILGKHRMLSEKIAIRDANNSEDCYSVWEKASERFDQWTILGFADKKLSDQDILDMVKNGRLLETTGQQLLL